MLNVSQSLLHPDQYRFGIKSPVLLYSLSIDQPLQLIKQQLNQLNRLYNYDLQLGTAFCKLILLL